MAFLNKKERVIDLQLTQYGKYLFSEGRLQPAFYAFYDDDIVYDNAYADSTIHQNLIETNITSSLRSDTQYVFAGIETNFNKIKKGLGGMAESIWQPDDEGEGEAEAPVMTEYAPPGYSDISFHRARQNDRDREFGLTNPLGTSEIASKYYPAWNIKFLYGYLSGSSVYTDARWRPPCQIDNNSTHLSSSHHSLRLPRLQTNLEYVVSRKDMKEDELPTERAARAYTVDDELNAGADDDISVFVGESVIFEDDTYIDVKDDYLLLRIEELNTLFENENFDIEVFEVREVNENNNQDAREELLPLKFADTDDVDNLTPNYVEYYFELLVDREIDQDLIRELEGEDTGVRHRRQKNIYKSITGLDTEGIGVEDGCDI